MKLKEIKKHIYTSSDNDLIKFIAKNLEQRGSLNESEYKNNLNTLSQLDIKTLNIGIARMVGIQENSNIFSWIASFVTLTIALVTALNKTYRVIFGDGFIAAAFYLVIILVVLFSIITMIKRSGDKRITAFYFAELLKSIKK